MESPPSAQSTGERGAALGDTADDFSRVTHTGPRPADSGSEIAGDPALAFELKGRLAHERARTVSPPPVRDGDGVSTIGTRTSTRQAAQAAFVEEMRARGVAADDPPAEAQLRAYFRTFDNREDRPQALEAYARYSGAFHAHPAETDRRSEDIEYRGRPVYVRNGRMVGPETPGALRVTTRSAESWDEVTTRRRTYEGRRVNDCEGFAYMGEQLLGEAGYRTQGVTAATGNGEGHAMTLARDPQTGRTAVISNARVFDSGPRQAQLDAAFRDATRESPPRGYFIGRDQAEAQALWTESLQ